MGGGDDEGEGAFLALGPRRRELTRDAGRAAGEAPSAETSRRREPTRDGRSRAIDLHPRSRAFLPSALFARLTTSHRSTRTQTSVRRRKIPTTTSDEVPSARTSRTSRAFACLLSIPRNPSSLVENPSIAQSVRIPAHTPIPLSVARSLPREGGCKSRDDAFRVERGWRSEEGERVG